MTQKKLELYYFPQCPYCQIVLEAIKRLDITVEMKNIFQDQSAHNTLNQVTGRSTVPCLFIDGSPMHESRDIVAWLENNH